MSFFTGFEKRAKKEEQKDRFVNPAAVGAVAGVGAAGHDIAGSAYVAHKERKTPLMQERNFLKTVQPGDIVLSDVAYKDKVSVGGRKLPISEKGLISASVGGPYTHATVATKRPSIIAEAAGEGKLSTRTRLQKTVGRQKTNAIIYRHVDPKEAERGAAYASSLKKTPYSSRKGEAAYTASQISGIKGKAPSRKCVGGKGKEMLCYHVPANAYEKDFSGRNIGHKDIALNPKFKAVARYGTRRSLTSSTVGTFVARPAAKAALFGTAGIGAAALANTIYNKVKEKKPSQAGV